MAASGSTEGASGEEVAGSVTPSPFSVVGGTDSVSGEEEGADGAVGGRGGAEVTGFGEGEGEGSPTFAVPKPMPLVPTPRAEAGPGPKAKPLPAPASGVPEPVATAPPEEGPKMLVRRLPMEGGLPPGPDEEEKAKGGGSVVGEAASWGARGAL